MTIYDIGAIIILSVGAAGLLASSFLALLGRLRSAKILFGVVAGGAITTAAASTALALASKQPPLGVGDPQ